MDADYAVGVTGALRAGTCTEPCLAVAAEAGDLDGAAGAHVSTSLAVRPPGRSECQLT